MWIKIIFLFSIFFMQSNSENLIWLLPGIVNEIMKIGYLYVYVIKILFRPYSERNLSTNLMKKWKKIHRFQNSINQDIYKRLFECNREQSVLKTLLQTRASWLCGKCLRQLKSKKMKRYTNVPSVENQFKKALGLWYPS